jgi:hypothetical protein
MWWRLGVLGAGTFALLIVLFAPIGHVTIKIQIPPVRLRTPARLVYMTDAGVAWMTDAAVIAVVLGVAGWIAWRIVRRHRIAN